MPHAGLGYAWIGTAIQVGVQAGSAAYQANQSRKMAEASIAAQQSTDMMAMMANMAANDNQLALQQQQWEAQEALLAQELKALEEERALQMDAQRSQLDWIKAERARQQAILDEEAQLKAAILNEQLKQVQFEGQIRETQRDALRHQLEQEKGNAHAQQQIIMHERTALSDEALAMTGAKKSNTPLLLGGAAAAAALMFLG